MLLSSLILVTLFVSSSTAQDSSVEFSGTVVDAQSSLPLPGVLIEILPAIPQPYPVITNAEGRFAIRLNGGRRYRVVPSLTGYVHFNFRQRMSRDPGIFVDLESTQPAEDVRIVMVKQGIITGTVLDAKGVPIANTRVQLFRYRYNEFGIPEETSFPTGVIPPRLSINPSSNPFQLTDKLPSFTKTDDRGVYRFYGLQSDDYFVVAFGPTQGPALLGNSAGGVYYPGTLERSQADSIHLQPGEEIQLRSITIPDKTSGVAVRFWNSNPAHNLGQVVVDLGEGGILFSSAGDSRKDPIAYLPRVAPGQYEVLLESTNHGVGGDKKGIKNLYYAKVEINVGTADIDRDVTFHPGIAVKTSIVLRDANGNATSISNIQCRLRSQGNYFLMVDGGDCNGSFIPGHYSLSLEGIPPDEYVFSATVGEKDILEDGFQLTDDCELQIVLSKSGGRVFGVITDADGNRVSNAIVAVVPDKPLRQAWPIYRSEISDQNGNYQLQGIRPGSYHVFAWRELNGESFRNPDFLDSFEARGIEVKVSSQSALEVNATAIEALGNLQVVH